MTRTSSLDMSPSAVEVQAQRHQALPRTISKTVGDAGFDIFLSYNSLDREWVQGIRDSLERQGLACWMDSMELAPGDHVAAQLETLLDTVPVAAIIVGGHAMGPWQRHEYYAFLNRWIRTTSALQPVRLIPVLITGANGPLALPPLVRSLNMVDLRTDWAAGMQRLADATHAHRKARAIEKPLPRATLTAL